MDGAALGKGFFHVVDLEKNEGSLEERLTSVSDTPVDYKLVGSGHKVALRVSS